MPQCRVNKTIMSDVIFLHVCVSHCFLKTYIYIYIYAYSLTHSVFLYLPRKILKVLMNTSLF